MEEMLRFHQGPLIADIAAHVFSFLSVTDKQNVAQVCRYWRRIVYLVGLWKNVTAELPLQPSHDLIASFKTRGITRFSCLRSKEKHLSDLFNSVPNLTRINIKACPQVGEEFLMELSSSLTCLEHLAFRKCRQVTIRLLNTISDSSIPNTLKSLVLKDCTFVTDVGFKALMKNLSSLESLCLSRMELNNTCLQVLADSCPKLTSLAIQNCDWLTYNGLEFVAKKLKNIKRLDLQGCLAVDDDSIDVIVDNFDLEYLDITSVVMTFETIAHIARNLKGLKTFCFSCREESNGDYNVEEIEHMFLEVSKLQELESLTIGAGQEMSTYNGRHGDLFDKRIDLCILSSLKKLPNLKNLGLGGLRSITDKTVIQLADYLPKLETLTSLDCPNIKDTGITALCSRLKPLKVLDVRGFKLTDKGVKEMASKCGKLETLMLRANCGITTTGIKHLVLDLKSVTILDLFECSKVTDVDVLLIAICMPQLVQLNLDECMEVTDEGAVVIGENLKNLCHLTLVSTQISDKGFVIVSQNLVKLQLLAVGDCYISDTALVKGAMSLGNLKKIDFGSEETTDAGLKQAVQYLTGLVKVTLLAADVVTVKGIETIVNNLPNLNRLAIEECKQITEESVTHLENLGVIITVSN